MGLFEKLFNTKLFEKLFKSNKDITIFNLHKKLNLKELAYLTSYQDYYSEFLDGLDDKNKIITELFVFRAWTTQFGFRTFSSKPEISEAIIRKIISQGKSAKKRINQLEQVDIEAETDSKYIDLIDDRWRAYDKAFIDNATPQMPISSLKICEKLTEICAIQDPEKFAWICKDFINQLKSIREEALKIGLLSRNHTP